MPDPVIDSPGTGDSPPASGGGIKNWSNGKKLGVAGGLAVVIGVGLYLHNKNKAATTSSSPPTTLVTPTDSGQGIGTSGGSSGGDQGSSGTDGLTQGLYTAITQGDSQIAAALAALPQQPAPIVNVTAPASNPTTSSSVTPNQSQASTSSNAPSAGITTAGNDIISGANLAANPPSRPAWATNSFTNPGNHITYYGLGNESDVNQAKAAGYKVESAKAAGVPGGSTKAQYAYK